PGTPAGVLFSTFTGQTTSPLDEAVLRATLSGPGVTILNNYVLLSEHPGTLTLVARENDPLPVSLGFGATVRWSGFFQFWGTGVGTGQVLFLASIKGPGITTANDVGLWLMDEAGN